MVLLPIKTKALTFHTLSVIAYSTVAESISSRDPSKGSWYIQSLCEVWNDRALTNSLNIVNLLDRVSNKLAKHEGKGKLAGKVQSCEYSVIGKGKVFYFPERELSKESSAMARNIANFDHTVQEALERTFND